MLLEAVDEALLTDDDTRLGTADEFVPGKEHEAGTGGDTLLDGRLGVEAERGGIEEAAAAKVIEERDVMTAADIDASSSCVLPQRGSDTHCMERGMPTFASLATALLSGPWR